VGVFSRGRARLVAILSTLALVVPGVVVLGVAPAAAADDLLQITKTVNEARPTPGEVFTYTIQVSCSEQTCLAAQLTDTLPAELEGFAIQGATFAPAAIAHTVTWAPGGGATRPPTVVAGTALTVDFTQPTNTGAGLPAGSNFTVTISLQVPDDYPPGLSDPITNAAEATASNANQVTASVPIQIDSPVVIDVAVDKSWQPARQVFLPGAPSTIGLDARNTSNVPVEVVTIQEPKAAPDGAPSLDPSNPFAVTDFTGFGDVALPAGCATVQVDAYTFDGTGWDWTPGDAQAPPVALPAGVAPEAVGGLRITCTGTIAPGATLGVDLDLELRATDRDDDSDLSTEERVVTNTTTGSVAGQNQTATDDGTAGYTITPLVPTVEASKNIQSDRITAGQSATATIAGTNGDTPVTSLSIADLDFFTDEITFGGFTAPLTWPAAATEATLVYLLPDGTQETLVVAEGETPADPTEPISGFTITWTGPIAASETGGAAFGIDTTEAATGAANEITVRNEVDAEVAAVNGLTDEASASDTLQIVNPRIAVTLDKTIRPSAPVEPGETVISSLAANATSTGDGAAVDTIVVEDAWAPAGPTRRCDEFWNAFDLSSIAATQVPASTTLRIEVRGPAGWVPLTTYGPLATATVFQRTASEVAADLAPLTAQQVEGIRFTFEQPAGFAANTTVTPNVVFAARGSLRDSSCPPPPTEQTQTYTNAATATVEGETAGGATLTDQDDDSDDATVIVPEGGGGSGPGVSIAKGWDRLTVASQSSQQALTPLTWSVDAGLSPVTITDPATPTPVSGSVFDAFDLVRIEAVGASSTPYANGWWLKYDTVTRVELFNGLTWTTVAAPAGTWMTAARGFKGHTLTAAQRQSTVAVRITLEETTADTAARQAALSAPGAGFDPFAPQPGSGVGAGSTDRRFDLRWQLRDRARSDNRFVIEDALFNTADAGVVSNSVALEGTPLAGGAPIRETASDTIQILDPVPLVSATKTVTPTSDLYTPPVGTPPGDYPTATWTITGRNGSVAKASYVRLTDPATCTDTALAGCQSAGTPGGAIADPFDTSGATDYLDNPSVPNPFQRFDVTRITIAASIPAEVDLAATRVWLLRWSAGLYTTQQTTASAVNALTAEQLADVVGFSVTFQGADPAANGGTITQGNSLTVAVDSRLRPTLRSTGEDQVLRADQTRDVTNRVFAQSYDPVTSPGVVTGDVADATTVLTGGVINVTPTKGVSPGTITQPDADADRDTVTVTLGADQGSDPRSTLSPSKVVIEDQAKSPGFWDAFDFAGLGSVTLPQGADRVQVDLYDGSQWVLGAPAATAVLPAVPLAQVQGIRFTFTRANGALFSTTLPAPNWSASASYTVNLRTTYRGSGDPMAFPSTVTNTQTAQSTRPDGNDSQAKDATATVQLVEGTRELAVNKLTNDGVRLAAVGDNVPFDLTLRNVGTGYLTLDRLRDVLPPQLVYTGDPAPVYTAAAAGGLSGDVTLTPSPDGQTLTFTWPEDGNLMLPGETFVIRLFLELQPGLGSGQTATNTMTVQTQETLGRCTNTVAGGSTTPDFAQDPTTCGTSDFVGVVGGPNLFTVKGVQGALPGAYNPTSPDSACIPSLTVDGEPYYRAPCVAHSTLGEVDRWVLHTVNAGTVNVDELTVFDQLPVAGDRLLVTGNSRGSQYRPQLVPGSIAVLAPAGTTWQIQVTTSPDVCVGTWPALPAAEPCVQSGETWSTADLSTDWSAVTGMRVRFDFTSPAKSGRSLLPGEGASVTFETVNRPQTDADPSGASTSVPAADQLAWNQFGVRFRNTGSSTFSKLAPNRVGVHLRVGSIQVVKRVTGPAAGYAPDEFAIDVQCRFDDVPLDLGEAATLALTEADGLTARIDGIPVGSECVVAEQGEPGVFGETSRTGTPTTLQVLEPTDPTVPADQQDVPEAQIATITNDYRFTGLSVTKAVQTQATGAQLGPFQFALTCTSATGRPVTFDDEGSTEVSFRLAADETWSAPMDRIPVGASCTLRETDTGSADGIAFTGDNVIDNGDGTATITPGPEPAAIQVTNAFDAGTVTIAKVVDGAGAALWGAGPFTFDVTCTWQGQSVFDDAISLLAGGSSTIGPYPSGTRCTVVESASAGATSVTLDPADGVVEVPRSDDGTVPNVVVTATNTFALTSLDVEKVVTGDLTADGAAGPFTVSLACTWLVDGQRVPFAVPGGADRVLSAANGYRASYADLPSSSACELTEVGDGGAESTSITASIAGSVTSSSGASIGIDLSTTSGPGQALVTVTNEFVDEELEGTDDATDDGLADSGADVARQVALALLLLVLGAAGVRRSRREV
jgi:large repetitive protein